MAARLPQPIGILLHTKDYGDQNHRTKLTHLRSIIENDLRHHSRAETKLFRNAEVKMPNVTSKALTLLVVPAVLALTAQTAASAKPYNARTRSVAARQQSWSVTSLPYRMPLDSAAPEYTTGGGIRSNDPNVYRDDQPIPAYDINPHGG